MAEAIKTPKPLPVKLGVKAGMALLLVGEPDGFARTLGALPAGTAVRRAGSPEAAVSGADVATHGHDRFDVAVCFARLRSELHADLALLRPLMHPAAGLWIAWPKRASGLATELSDDVVRESALSTGLVDNKVCAVDATWTGLRLVIRKESRST